jgi:hypothetical protein
MLQLCGVISVVDINFHQRYLAAVRDLKVFFSDQKRHFCVYSKWEKSGQMDAECESFNSFLPRVVRSSAELSQDSKSAAVMLQD